MTDDGKVHDEGCNSWAHRSFLLEQLREIAGAVEVSNLGALTIRPDEAGWAIGEAADTIEFLAKELGCLQAEVERLRAVADAADEVWNFCASDWTDKPVAREIMDTVNEQAMRLGKALAEAGY